MPDPQADPNQADIKRTALHAILAGGVITGLKFSAFAFTNSVAILSDAMESIINIVAAGVMLYMVWLSNRPADKDHPYGHGKAELLAVGLEGCLILFAGLLIGIEAVRRLFAGAELRNLDAGLWMLAGIGLLSATLAGYVWWSGKKYQSDPLIADGKHLMTDVTSTLGVLLGLGLVKWTGWPWLDPLVAILVAGLCLAVSWRLLWKSMQGLMDSSDPTDDLAIRTILDEEKIGGHILGYHKVRLRHSGSFHWVDMHLHVDGQMTVEQSHELASRIEGRIERELGRANATAHVEPYVHPVSSPHPAPPSASTSSTDTHTPQSPENAGHPPDAQPDNPHEPFVHNDPL